MTRAVVTGLGIVAPNGIGTAGYWANTLAGRSGIGEVSRFDVSRYRYRLAGEVGDFDGPQEVPARLAVQTDRWTHLALYATELAFADAEVDPAVLPEYDMGVMTASSSGGNEFGQREISALWTKGPRFVTPYQSIAWFYAATTGQISIRHGLRGPCGVVASEQAGGLDSVAQARRWIRSGTRLMVTGGTEAPLSPYAMTCQSPTGMLSDAQDPASAYLPFDATARGYVPGEGGAILIVEDAAVANGRVRPYGTIAGHAATFDAHDDTSGDGLRRAAELALADAGMRAGQVDVVFADGWGTPERDRAEAEAIGAVFGERGVPVTVPKTMTGRLYAGGAALDLATALLAMRDSIIPPTIGIGTPAPWAAGLDLVRDRPRPGALAAAMVLARGFGGFNSAMVLTRDGCGPDQEDR